jgi:putative flippase GtrA
MTTSAADYFTFFMLFWVANSGLLIATIAAYIVGLIVNYLLSRFWVYKDKAKGLRMFTSVWRYATILVVNLIITYIMLWAMENWLGLTPLLGKFVVWFFMTFWNYAANRLWVFKGPRQVQKKLFGM